MYKETGFDDVYKLSNIKRWAIIDMMREQSVAEHSFNVAHIASKFAFVLAMTPENELRLINWCMIHDLPEIVTADVPSPVKKLVDFNTFEATNFPAYHIAKLKMDPEILAITKVADLADAIIFAKRYCIDPRKADIINEMIDKLHSVADKNGLEFVVATVFDSGELDRE